MKVFTTNYRNCFIEMAEDCPVEKGEIPPIKKGGKTIANIQYEILRNNPYKYTSDEILLQCYMIKNNFSENDLTKLKEQFFSKGQPCFRASPLTKQYGWGIHYNHDMKMAIYGCETKEYNSFLEDTSLTIKKAMRSKKS